MSDLLTREEYEAIAKDTSYPSNSWINGKYTGARSGETYENFNPATGEKLCDIAACGKEDVDYAVKKSRQAFDAGVWSRLHPSERKDIMIKWVKRLKRNRYELAVLESIDSGKPVRDCATIDLEETIHCLAWYAEAADKIYDKIAPTQDDAMGLIVREPAGVAACVLPWNFPMLMLAWKAGPALAAGNSVIVKPAGQTSMTALRLAELATEAGIPDGVFNVITGGGGVVGRALGEHPDIDVLSFTGSTEVGRLFLKYAADSNLKKVTLELGGKNPAVVLSDAEHLDAVAEHVVNACFWNMGQNCTSNSRLIVHRDVKDELLEKVLVKVREWRTGDPLEPSNRLGSMVSKEHFQLVMDYIEKGKKDGAEPDPGRGGFGGGERLFHTAHNFRWSDARDGDCGGGDFRPGPRGHDGGLGRGGSPACQRHVLRLAGVDLQFERAECVARGEGPESGHGDGELLRRG